MKAPCLHCSRREVGCHGRCEAYREFRRDVEARRAYEKKYCTVDAMNLTRGQELKNRRKRYKGGSQ